MSGGKNILVVCVHRPHAGKCVKALHVINLYILQTCYFAVWLSTNLFIVMEIKSHNACEILWQNFQTFTNISQNTGSLLFTREINDTRRLHVWVRCELFLWVFCLLPIYKQRAFHRLSNQFLPNRRLNGGEIIFAGANRDSIVLRHAPERWKSWKPWKRNGRISFSCFAIRIYFSQKS